MEVTVAVPTYRNDGRTIGNLLEALTIQSWSDFECLIVHRFSPGDRTTSVVERYGAKLSLRPVLQDTGLLDEAMNLIYSNATGDVLVLTDDDALPPQTWVEQHVRAHEAFGEIGVLGVSRRTQLRPTGVKAALLGAYSTIFARPVDSRMCSYRDYVSDLGSIVQNNRGGGNTGSKWYCSFSQRGNNMSAKREAYRNFRTPEMTLRGIRHEQCLAINAFARGLDACMLNSGEAAVGHDERISMSRPGSATDVLMISAEGALFPYYVSKLYDVNVAKCRLYHAIYARRLRAKASNLEQLARAEGVSAGTKIALSAIEGSWSPKMIRDALSSLRGEAAARLSREKFSRQW